MSENIFDDFDVKSKGEVLYSKMGLEKNPFHREGLPPRDKIVELYTKRGKEDKVIANELVEAYGTQLSSGIFLVGAWGNGKTHTMLYFDHELRKSFDDVTTIHVAFSGTDITDLFKNILEKIGKEEIQEKIFNRLIDDLQPIYIKLVEASVGEELKDNKKCSDVSSFLRATNHGNLMKIRDDLSKKLAEKLEVPRYVSDYYTSLIFGKYHEDSWNCLTGDENSKYLKNLGVSKKVKETNHLILYRSLLSLLKADGITYMYVFLDQFEDIKKLGKRVVFDYLSNLRDIYDNIDEPICFIIAIQADEYLNLAGLYPAIFDRYEIVKLDISMEFIASVIMKHLKTFRVPEFEGDDMHPFTKLSIKKIVNKSEFKMRNIIKECYSLTKQAAMKDWDKITPDRIQDK